MKHAIIIAAAVAATVASAPAQAGQQRYAYCNAAYEYQDKIVSDTFATSEDGSTLTNKWHRWLTNNDWKWTTGDCLLYDRLVDAQDARANSLAGADRAGMTRRPVSYAGY